MTNQVEFITNRISFALFNLVSTALNKPKEPITDINHPWNQDYDWATKWFSKELKSLVDLIESWHNHG